MTDGGNTVPRITKGEHIGPDDTGDNIQAKRVANYSWNGTEWERSSSSYGKLVAGSFDYIEADYPNATTEVYSYKTGGAMGTTIATITVVYTTSDKSFIDTVTRS